VGHRQLVAEVMQHVKGRKLKSAPRPVVVDRILESGLRVEHYSAPVDPSVAGGDQDWAAVAAGNYVECAMVHFGMEAVQTGPEAEIGVSEAATCGQRDVGTPDVIFVAAVEGEQTGLCCVTGDEEVRWIVAVPY
jgi:hypothetical protein